MKVMLFLASGVSSPSRLPTVSEITDDLLSGEWSIHTDGRYFRGEDPSPFLADEHRATPEQQALVALRDAILPFLRRNDTKREVNYEDLFYVLRQLEEEDARVVGNPAIGPFYDHAKCVMEPPLKLLTKNRDFGHEYKFRQLCEYCMNLIADVVSANLQTPQEVIGLNLLQEVITDSSLTEINIVTLNHDLLIEKFLNEIHVGFVDGFETDPDGILVFRPENLTSDARVKVLKLHGSVDWYSIKTKEGHQLVKKPPFDCLSPLESRPIFLCGTDNKPLAYADGPFQDIHYTWRRMLEDCNLMIMSGYGWKDRGISGRILHWLSSKQNKLVLLAEDIGSLRTDSGANLAMRYDDFHLRDRIIPIRKWLQHTSWADVEAKLRLWGAAEGLSEFRGFVRKACQEFDGQNITGQSEELVNLSCELVLQVLKRWEVLLERLKSRTHVELMRISHQEDYTKLKEALICKTIQGFRALQSTITPALAEKIVSNAFAQVCNEFRTSNDMARCLSEIVS